MGQTFAADVCLLRPVENFTSANPSLCQFAAEQFTYATETSTSNGASALAEPVHALLTSILQSGHSQLLSISEATPYTQLIVPLIYQQEPLAVLVLHRQTLVEAWSEEDIRLIEGVAEQASLAISQAKLYQRTQKQTEQMRAELAVARQIQTNLLRQTFPAVDRVNIQAHCFPAHEIGGDFFEIFIHPQGDIWLAVGDVSGKGVPAALFMASAISLLRRELAQEASPAPNVVMHNLNHSLSDNLVGSNCFITMVLARYTPTTGELVYANAGHIYPLVWSQHQLLSELKQAGKVALEPAYLKVRGVPLGILPVWKANLGELLLYPGDVLLLTSDGITEATLINPLPEGRSMLRQEGLWQLITQQRGTLNLKDLLSTIQAQTQVQEDDQTVLSLEVL